MKKRILFFSLIISSLLTASSKKEERFIGQFVKPGGHVFDVGAHKGTKTDLYLKLSAQVLCIEPQPDCVRFLKQKYSNNPRVVIVDKGLSNCIGTMPLHVCSAAPTISTFSEQWQQGRFSGYSWDNTVFISMTTLDELIKEFGRPDFCKIDVEGFEYQVLMGLSSPISYVSFEFTGEFFANSELCIEHLQSLGYTLFNYALGENLEMVHNEWITAKQLIKEVKDNPDSLIWGDIYAHHPSIDHQ